MQMGIEQKTSGKKGKVYSESKKSRRWQKKMTIVQRLYQTCKEVFGDCDPLAADAAAVPSSDKLELLKSILDSMTEEDVGLSPNLPFFRVRTTEEPPRIAYLHIYECDKFSMGIFCLPPSAVIPLHNHPQMTVFSKLLFGTMHIKSYDWVNSGSTDTASTSSPSQSDYDNTSAVPPVSGARLAKVKVNSNFTAPCETSILYPTDGGNMHCFTALTACAVLDVLGPPYCDSDGRHCQYYFDYPLANSSGDERQKEEAYAWLKERERPEDLTIVGSMYNGPKIVPN